MVFHINAIFLLHFTTLIRSTELSKIVFCYNVDKKLETKFYQHQFDWKCNAVYPFWSNTSTRPQIKDKFRLLIPLELVPSRNYEDDELPSSHTGNRSETKESSFNSADAKPMW